MVQEVQKVQKVQWFKVQMFKSSMFSFADFCHDSAIQTSLIALAAPKVQSIFYSSLVIRH